MLLAVSRWIRAIALVLVAGTSHATAESAALNWSHRPTPMNDRFAYERRLGFVDDDRYVVVTECGDGQKRAAILGGRVSRDKRPKLLGRLRGCYNVFVGRGVVLERENGWIRYDAITGRRLGPVVLPAALGIREVLAADRTATIAVADRETGPSSSERVLVVLADRQPPKILPVHELEDATGDGSGADEQPRGILAATRGSDGTVWIAATGPRSTIRVIAWNPDTGKRVGFGGDCGEPWPRVDGEVMCVRRIEGGPTRVSRLDATGGVRWSTHVDDTLNTPGAADASGQRVVVPRSGKLAVFGGDGKAEVLDMPGAKPAERYETALALSPNGKRLLVALTDGTLQMWSLP